VRLKKLSVAIIALWMTSCTIPVVQDPIGLGGIAECGEFTRINHKLITRKDGIVSMPEEQWLNVIARNAEKTACINKYKAIVGD